MKELSEIPGVGYSKAAGTCWVVQFGAEEWLVWPNSGRWAYSQDGQQVSDLYFGGVRYFVDRYLIRKINFPANHCKAWTEAETDCIYEMYDLNMSIKQIAVVLERYPPSMISRIGMLFDIDLHALGFQSELLLEVGLKELLEGDAEVGSE